MQSIYKARIKEHGSVNQWWSAKPKEYEHLKGMDVFSQIAGQVYFTNKAIETALSKIPSKSKLEIHYEDLVENPHNLFKDMQEKYMRSGCKLSFSESSEVCTNIRSGNIKSLDVSILDKLQDAYNRLVSKNG